MLLYYSLQNNNSNALFADTRNKKQEIKVVLFL